MGDYLQQLGALAIGFAYRFVRRDEAALFEPVGTVPVGATPGSVLLSSFLEAAGGGLIALMVAFPLSSIPGAVMGYVVLKALRRLGTRGDGGAKPGCGVTVH